MDISDTRVRHFCSADPEGVLRQTREIFHNNSVRAAEADDVSIGLAITGHPPLPEPLALTSRPLTEITDAIVDRIAADMGVRVGFNARDLEHMKEEVRSVWTHIIIDEVWGK